MEVVAPVILPHNALITSIHASVKDSDGTNDLTLQFFSATDGQADQQMHLLNSTSGSPGITTIDNTGLSLTIDNLNRYYFLRFNWHTGADTTLIEITRVLITYTVETPYP